MKLAGLDMAKKLKDEEKAMPFWETSIFISEKNSKCSYLIFID